MEINNIDVITFDADDTLWVNESYFQETRYKFGKLLEDFMPYEQVEAELSKTEIQDLPLYGYGVKPFTLSMVETATRIAGSKTTGAMIDAVLALGREILNKPVEVIDGVEDVLEELSPRFRLAVATKGDLLDQKRKLYKSGLINYFDHIEIMSDKKTRDYSNLMNIMDCKPDDFMMIGNSVRSDILPVLELGGYAIHVPFSVTWDHEEVEGDIVHPKFKEINNIREVLPLLDKHRIKKLA
ncbi:MAG: HAD family hydrolase [Dysgonomonas sp.]